jgi:cyclic pyranopterin phosphate synthase
MNIFGDFELVALIADLPQFQLTAGDIGTIVDIYGDDSVMVEFIGANGEVLALLTMDPAELRHTTPAERDGAFASVRVEPLQKPEAPRVTQVPVARQTVEPVPAPPSAPEPAVSPLSHIDETGRARMVDVTAKDETLRVAVARGRIVMEAATLQALLAGTIAKGNVLTTAQVAGVMAAKRTHELIPMCHPLLLTGIDVVLEPDEAASAVEITATVRTTGKTGVEMEALTAVTVAGLTVYDMCKAIDRGMRLEGVRLASKSGGDSGDYRAE